MELASFLQRSNNLPVHVHCVRGWMVSCECVYWWKTGERFQRCCQVDWCAGGLVPTYCCLALEELEVLVILDDPIRRIIVGPCCENDGDSHKPEDDPRHYGKGHAGAGATTLYARVRELEEERW